MEDPINFPNEEPESADYWLEASKEPAEIERWIAADPFETIGFDELKPGRRYSSRFVGACVTNALEGAFDQLLPLFADVVIDRCHRLNRAGGRSGEGEFAIHHLALVQCERAIAKDNKPAVGKYAGFVLMEIKDDFFIFKLIFGDFHLVCEVIRVSGVSRFTKLNESARHSKLFVRPAQSLTLVIHPIRLSNWNS